MLTVQHASSLSGWHGMSIDTPGWHQHTQSIVVCPYIIAVGWHIGTWPLHHVWKEVRGRRESLTWVDDGGDMCPHRLNNLAHWRHARSSPSPVIHSAGDMALPGCHCCWHLQCWFRALNDGCRRQSLSVMVLTECGSVVVSGHVTDVALACCVKKGEGGGEGSSCAPELMRTVTMIVSSLDNVVWLLTWQIIAMTCWAADVALACCVKKGEGAGRDQVVHLN